MVETCLWQCRIVQKKRNSYDRAGIKKEKIMKQSKDGNDRWYSYGVGIGCEHGVLKISGIVKKASLGLG